MATFRRKLGVLTIGTLLAQLIGVFSIPLFARMYVPEDFGYLSIFISGVSIISIFSTGRYELAIMQSSSPNRLLAVSLFNSVLFFIILSLLLIIIDYFEILDSSTYTLELLLLVSVGGLATSFFNSLNSRVNKQGRYKKMAVGRVVNTFSCLIITIAFYYLEGSYYGLIIGSLLGTIFANVFYFYDLRISYIFKYNFNKIRRFYSKYKSYPKYDLPSSLMNTFSIQGPFLVYSYYLSPASLGMYFMVHRVLSMPINALASSIGSVFREEATRENSQSGNYNEIFNSVLSKLFLTSAPVFSTIYIFSQDIVSLVLGDSWEGMHHMIDILLPFYFFKFIASPLSYSFYISEKLKWDFWGQLCFSCCVLLSISLTVINDDIMYGLKFMSVGGSVIYFLYIVWSFKLSKGVVKRV